MLQWLGCFPVANKLQECEISGISSLLDCHPVRDWSSAALALSITGTDEY